MIDYIPAEIVKKWAEKIKDNARIGFLECNNAAKNEYFGEIKGCCDAIIILAGGNVDDKE